ncbi:MULTISPECIES: SH3 domain-containing protein [Caldilinea]|uniref:SH3 domain-containing protein n=1 Tax=Caldilinea TaxID=233191 RepID=UPI0002E46BD3|nr:MULTISPECIES: SH3 domain-containing protein [Caldilinea]GIV71967.1 MAG: hypothetical protein KatS3mg049_0523 [Caldilinea sp.]
MIGIIQRIVQGAIPSIRVLWTAAVFTVALVILSGCSLFFGAGEPEPTPTPAAARSLVPTFTPTPVTEAPTPTPEAPEVAPTLVIALDVGSASLNSSAEEASSQSAEPTATPSPRLTTKEAAVNVRLGPGTNYGLAGVAEQGQEFTIVGVNPDRTWWLICCVNGKEAWIFGELTERENDAFVPVVEDIPAPPQQVAQAPAQQPAAPSEPSPTPAPQPPPADDPCANIGGDGCKFRLRNGPSFAPNGGTELKLQIHFIHSGVEGGQPQGSYFVWLEKDGVKLPVADGVRSIALQSQQGTLGKFNYEYKIGLSDIPGNNVAGTYAIWVLDGNGERDSQTYTFTVPEGQGEVWMEFDQG